MLLWKSQQLVPVILVLLSAGLDLGGQAAGQVIAEGVEAVEDGDDAVLFFQRGKGNGKLSYLLHRDILHG